MKMVKYKVSTEKLQKANIKPEVGTKLTLTLQGGRKVDVQVTQINNEEVIATSK